MKLTLIKIDVATSMIAALSLFIGGFIGLMACLVIVHFAFITFVPLSVKTHYKSALGIVFVLLIFGTTIFAAYAGSKFVMKQFMTWSKQVLFNEAYKVFILLVLLSPLSLVAIYPLAKDNLYLNYCTWTITIAGLYLAARLIVLKRS